jgi:hypothetical protein
VRGDCSNRLRLERDSDRIMKPGNLSAIIETISSALTYNAKLD